jgi:hypothetical protein
MCADRRAIELEDPGGIRVMGARITGALDLAHLHVPAPLELRNCSILEEMALDSAEFPGLSLNGSHTGAIYAAGIKVVGKLDMGRGFDASAEVYIPGATIDGTALFSGGRFHHSIAPRKLPPEWVLFESRLKVALNIHDAQIWVDEARSALVSIGTRAGVMRLTWPENTAPPAGHPTAGLNPLLYSLDVFLPFVNLHQEHYWWPDETTSGECAIFGRRVPIRGSVLRYYLWLQIMAGWLLSAVFIAGLTGLIQND